MSVDATSRAAGLSAAKRALLERMLQGKAPGDALLTIAPRPRTPESPLSFAQQRLWFIHQIDPASPAYNVPVALRLRGRLDGGVLHRCLQEVQRRHESLRTRFETKAGSPAQVIDLDAHIELPVVDLTHLPASARALAAQRLAGEEASAPFDLERGALIRSRLLRLAEDDHVFLLTMHHIVSDGWSMGVLVREVAALYEAFTAGRPSPLPDLPIQYADFAAWQRDALSGERLERELAYWRARLTPLPPALDVPADRPRPPVQTFRGGVERVTVPADVASAMRTLARREGATLFMGLLAAFDALLARLSGEEDVTIGTGIANRTLPELESLVGFFVNALVIRASCAGDPSFRELLGRVREATLGAFSHQDLPFERLVEALQPARDLSRNPIFQIAFALQNAPLGSFELPGLSIEPVVSETGATRFDLEFHLWEAPGGALDGYLFYSADLFDAATVRRMAGRYLTLLAAAVAAPESRLSQLRLTDEAETQRATRMLACGEKLPVAPRRVIELFEEQAARAPDALALQQGGRSVTYGELAVAAARLAARLRAAGAGREARVAVLADRSIEQVIAILAAAKAGAAYVPLDPANPDERLGSMLSRSGARVALAPGALAPRLSGKVPVLAIDAIEGATPLLESPCRDRPDASPADLAYLIFTSGSTGEPNGVEVTQANLSNLVAWHRAAFALGPADRATLIAGVGFDASVWELWPALASGACLLIPDESTRLDPAALVAWLATSRVTVTFLPTPLAELVLAREWPRACSLRTLLTGGDRLHAVDTGRLPFRVVNNYGPTEATVVATSGEVDAGAWLGAPTLGRPIANARAYVLDAHLRPVPIGVPGELHVGGLGVARGYAGDAALTAACFLPDPFGEEAGARLYRTGDRVRQLEDGRIEFLGRLDQQVKVRGHRIEPAEIETALAQHPGVERAAVIPHRENGETRLIAYVVPRRRGREGARWESEHIERWRTLYDETYGRTPAGHDPSFNITGWNSSYTGCPIDPEEMREWRDRTVERILEMAPQRVLEIGCGTGLLLTQIAARCRRYLATDFSAVSVELVRQAVKGRDSLSHVELLQRDADDFAGMAPGSFDTVILNSVVQYFPDAEYLERVLEGAMSVLSDDGRVFIGDVRDARLHRAFAASVALFRAPQGTAPAEARERAERVLANEEELLIDPEYFARFAARITRRAWAEARVKQGRADNELTRFRYDAVLHLGEPAPSASPVVPWGEAAPSQLLELFQAGAGEIVLRGVPNARVAGAVAAAQALSAGAKIGDFAAIPAGARHPDDVAGLGAAHGYTGVAGLSSHRGDLFDAAFVRGGSSATTAFALLRTGKDVRRLTNTPLRATLVGTLGPALREFAAARLPDPMVPSTFVLVDALPLTPNGKVDRRALPAPSAAVRRRGEGVAPRTPAEREVARVWTEVLGVERVEATDDFFDLGGHSLLATQVIARLRSALGVEVPLRAVFEAPTVETLAAFLDAAAPTVRGGPIPRLDRAGRIPLSFAQQRLWFIDKLEPGVAAYNIPNALRFEGEMDAGALGRALSEILRRHEALRTRFVEGPVGAEQVVDPPSALALPVEDLAAAPDPEAEARRIVATEAFAPFDLARGPVLRARLLRLAPREHVLSLVVHHIAADGWSTGVLVRELGALYAAADGAGAALPEPRIQYADWAAWQRTWLEGGELRRQIDYWKEALGGVEPLALPTDAARPSHPSYAGAALDVKLEERLVGRITRLARAEGATLHMALLAAFAAVLGRWSGQTDFAVGTPVAGRTREETEQLIGFFVNTLALRVRLDGRRLTYRELLGRIRETALGAYANQEVPFERVVEEIRPERDTSRNPIFQTLFALHNVPLGQLTLPGLVIRPFAIEPRTCQFDLEVSLFEADGAVEGRLHWSTDLFERETMQRLASHFLRFVELAAEDPDVAVWQAPILPEAERRKLLREFNGARRTFEIEPTLVRLFEAQVERHPERVAVRAAGIELSYAELEARANRLARLLSRDEVRRGDRVGICLERGVDRVASVIAALKAGAAYVPLDPAYPAARLALMLEDARVAAVVTTDTLARTLPVTGGRIVCLDREEETLARLDGSRLGVETSSDDLVYVIYTSGSTGRPKGVAMPQGALLNLIAWQHERSAQPLRRTLQYSSLSFDASFHEIFSTFAEGGTLVLISEADRRDPVALLGILVDEKVERLFLPFVALQSLAEAAEERRAVLPLREVVTAGEQLHVTASIRRLFQGLPGGVLDNHYGPSETHVVTAERLDGDPFRWPELPAIGRPVDNTRVYVLDEWLEPAPLGVAGEIYLGGQALARGYLDRADLTSERFLPDPFEPGGRLYRTGDRGRVLSDGRVEFLGRVDRQIKIRGFRVEPGEIEAVLARCEGVRAAAVEARAWSGNPARLAAYVVLEEGLRGRARGLRDELARVLPEHLVPSAFVELDALPLTPSGKVDRRALPDPEPETPPARADLSPLEAIVAGVFEETLGAHRLGRDAHFFELGGHSLLATKAISRLRRIAGVDLPLRALFDAPVLRDLARVLAAAMRGGEPGVGRIPRAERGPRVPVSFQQERMWFLDRFDPGGSAFSLTAAVRLRGELDVTSLERALAELARRHESLRTRFEAEDGRPVQVIQPPGPVDLELLDLGGSADAESRLQRRLEQEALAPFDLASRPAWRVALLRVHPRDHTLIVAMHHILTDGWSMGVLVRELGALYEAYARGGESPLAELPIQYADYAVWQRRWLAEGELDRQLDFWRRELAGVEPLDLPANRTRPALQSHAGARVRGRLEPHLAERLGKLARSEGATLQMVLLAAYALVLQRWSGQEDFAIGIPVANRTREETEGLIGFFVNTLAVRARFQRGEEGGTFRDLLARVRESSLGAYAHQDLPFESLLGALNPRRDLSRTPVFQVWFNFVNVPEEAASFGELEAEALGAQAVDAKFDLSLYVTEAEGAIDLDAVYSTDLFDAWRIEEFLEQFTLVLRQICESSELALDDVSLVTERARLELPSPLAPLSEQWQGAVHDLFAGQAARDPGALAVLDACGGWTYGELDARCNQLARWLSGQGIDRGDAVAVYAHRSAATVWAMLGVLRSGAAITMLDPSHPAARLLACLEEARPRAWVQVEAAGPLAPELAAFIESAVDARIVLPPIDQVAARDPLAGIAAAPVAVEIGPDDPACITFTSGSTGAPRGVVGRHGSLSHFQPFLAGRFGIGRADRFSMLSGLAHDPLQRDVFTPLMAGAAVCAPEPDDLDPARLADWAQRLGVTVMTLTPAMAKILAGERWAGTRLPSLRLIFLVGEQLMRRDVERLRALAPGATLVNLYGTTETQRAVGYFVLPAGGELRAEDGAPIRQEAIPAGLGMGDAQLLVRRAGGRAAGLCEMGEIWMRSPHLALGYLDEALTRRRFEGTGSARSYKTGDVGRYLPGGIVTIVGRRDDQVNVRGFRVELGEVEAALAAHAGVRDAAAVLDAEGRLVGYVTAGAQAHLDPIALRQATRGRLPDYMVPAAVVVLAALPLTPNGKVDRRALPAPHWGAAPDHVAPRTSEEEAACALFAQVLEVERVGATDSFFDLGGHSLLATRLLSRVRSSLGAEVTLRALFEAPTPAGLARAVAARRRDVALPPITRAAASSRRHLSYAQRRLWFLDRLEPDNAAYNVAMALRLVGDLDIPALGRALAELERRHEALRTRIVSGAEGAEQVFDPPRASVLSLEDLKTSADPLAAALRRVGEEAGRPFDLAREPLWRARLLCTGAREHTLCLVLHHIITDGWSMDLILREMAALYAAFSEGKDSPLADLSIQYADWAAWQRDWLEGGELDRQLTYWRRELADVEPLEIPTDRPRPPRRGLRGARESFELEPDDAAALVRLAREEGATLFHALFACFQALLARYAASEDVVVGTPVANRSLTQAEPLVGFFANTLPVRAQVKPDWTLRDLVRRVGEKILDAYAHQDVPFETIVDALNLRRDLSRNPLFDAMFVLQHAGTPIPAAGSLVVEPLPADTGATPFDLTLAMADAGGRILGSLQYDADLFEAVTIRRMLAHFAGLVRRLVGAPDTRLEDLDLRTGEELALVQAANATTVARPPRRAHDRVEQRAALAGSDIAVIDEEVRLSYAELEALSNRIARRLRRQGIGPEEGVGWLPARTARSIAGMLGILKSGGVLVPLDAALPAPRLAVMLSLAGVRAVVSERGLDAALPAAGLPVVRLDTDDLSSESAERPESPARPANAAYVIFTSGSTGEPKGVVVEHHAIAERTVARMEQAGLGPGDRVLHFLSPVFDAALEEILTPLSSGAALVVHPDPRGETPEGFLHRVAVGGLTVAHLPVGFLHELADDLAKSGAPIPPSLRLIVTGGESPSGARVAALLRAAPGRLTVSNAYGPTEAVIDATAYDARSEAESSDPLPIGRPAANTTVHLLDARWRPVPVGASGEIFIGGRVLARSYAGRSADTAACFVPDPFSPEPGARLYRTGDLARRRADGELVFLGRRDGQVKLRGFRIEMGEIETALIRLAGVRDAVVARCDDGAGGYLAAYVVPEEGRAPDLEGLRAALRATLPDYMVPARFVALGELPRTATDKVDRRALPAPDRIGSERAGVAPRDELERDLARLWAEALGGGGIDVEQNFFEAGGHSLLAVRLIAAIRRELGAELPVAALFREPTIAGLARLLRGAASEPSPLVMLRPGAGLPPLVCVHEIGGGVSAFSALADHLDPRRPVLGIHGFDDSSGNGIEEAAAGYAGAITRAVPEGPLDLLGWSYGGLVAYETARRLRAAGREVRTLVLLDAPAPEDAAPEGSSLARAVSALWGLEVEEPDRDGALAAARQAGALPDHVDGEQAAAWLAGVAARIDAADAYRPQPYDGKVVLVRGTESVVGRARDDLLGWRPLVTGSLALEWAPGSHYSVVSGEGARAVAAIVERHAARVVAADT